MSGEIEARLKEIESRGKRRDPATENPCDEWWLCCVVRELQARLGESVDAYSKMADGTEKMLEELRLARDVVRAATEIVPVSASIIRPDSTSPLGRLIGALAAYKSRKDTP